MFPTILIRQRSVSGLPKHGSPHSIRRGAGDSGWWAAAVKVGLLAGREPVVAFVPSAVRRNVRLFLCYPHGNFIVVIIL